MTGIDPPKGIGTKGHQSQEEAPARADFQASSKLTDWL
jgi:hypothetical protein